MKNKLLYTFVLALALTSCSVSQSYKLASPDGRLVLKAEADDGRVLWSLNRDDGAVVLPSQLGFTLNDGEFKDFEIVKARRANFDETWEQVWGEDRYVRNHYNELTLTLRERSGAGRLLQVVFRLFDDGLGFRYVFPEQDGLEDFVIMDEATEYALPWDAVAWTIPTEGTHYYEGIYKAAPLSEKAKFSTPATLEVNDSLYIALHEANLTDYSSLNLEPVSGGPDAAVTLKAELVPWSTGELVFAKTPFATPWRTVIVGSSPADLMLSRLMLNLNEPCALDDVSWIKPGRYVGIWWGMHILKYTWSQGPKHGATTENTMRYIDFAAEHGFDGVLVEGWNRGWDGDWTRYGDKFSFTQPYPDYDLEGLCEYAASKGVRIIAHNETGGAASNYERQLDSAFALYNRLGINTVKTGYVNDLHDGKELQHSQYGVRHYRKVVETAAKYHIMIDNHEPAMPTGIQRTYPNLMTQEGVRGQEYNAFDRSGGNPPGHVCTLPFTRGLAGPMDYTPGVFNFRNPALPDTHPQGTLAKELALAVILYSPLQMACDLVENYENQPALSFVTSCPTTWSETVVPEAKIGDYVIVARKDRGSEDWFIGGITDETARDFSLPLSFLDENSSYIATIYADGPGADYESNPYPVSISQVEVTSASVLGLNLARSGGVAIRIEKL